MAAGEVVVPEPDVETGSDWAARDADAILGWRYQPRVIFHEGRGVHLVDVTGKEYYDGTSGMMSLPLGHCHPELTAVLREQAGRFVHHSSWYANTELVQFAELLTSTLPEPLRKVNFAVTGSEANEVALRIARAATSKTEVVHVMRGLHGGTLAVESITTVGGPRRKQLGPLMMPARGPALLAPLCYRCPINLDYPSCRVACLDWSRELLDLASTQDVAAIIAETVLVAGGMIVPPREWLQGLRALADELGALLILDEAQLAPARTGRMWGFEHYDVVPDAVVFAKGMGAGLPITGVVTTDELAAAASGTAGVPWGGTFTGDPLAAAVARRQLSLVIEDGLCARAAELGERLAGRLAALQDRSEVIGDVRGLGLYRVLDVVADRASREPHPSLAEQIRLNALELGVVLISVRNFVRICPPLISTEDQIDELADRVETAVHRAVEQLRAGDVQAIAQPVGL